MFSYLEIKSNMEIQMITLSKQEMQKIVEDRICELMTKFEEVYGSKCRYDADFPEEIRFDQGGRCAGKSCFHYGKGSGYLNFNPILMKDNWEVFDNTVIHEVAHYCVSLAIGAIYTRAGRRVSHGVQWKRMMVFLGGEVRRCHSYDTKNIKTRRQRKWAYTCDCSTHQVSTTLHNKMKKGQQRVCNRCKCVIKYTGV